MNFKIGAGLCVGGEDLIPPGCRRRGQLLCSAWRRLAALCPEVTGGHQSCSRCCTALSSPHCSVPHSWHRNQLTLLQYCEDPGCWHQGVALGCVPSCPVLHQPCLLRVPEHQHIPAGHPSPADVMGNLHHLHPSSFLIFILLGADAIGAAPPDTEPRPRCYRFCSYCRWMDQNRP